jgi:hypothetical protein
MRAGIRRPAHRGSAAAAAGLQFRGGTMKIEDIDHRIRELVQDPGLAA